jgi:hypothetical protein
MSEAISAEVCPASQRLTTSLHRNESLCQHRRRTATNRTCALAARGVSSARTHSPSPSAAIKRVRSEGQGLSRRRRAPGAEREDEDEDTLQWVHVERSPCGWRR